MKLVKLQLTNYRNILSSLIEFNEGINCIFGNNGNGKTNLLEAIYYLINKKSFRKNTTFPQLVSIESEKPEILINSLFSHENKVTTFSGKIDNNNSSWFLDNKPTKKKINSKTVFINPFDSYSFHNTPGFRRSLLDGMFSDISKEYKDTLKKYNQALKFRNNLLSKKPQNFIEQILVIDEQIATYSVTLISLKKENIQKINTHCTSTFKKIFHENHELKLELDSKFNNLTAENIQNFLKENLEKDSIIGHSRYGVHKDDYVFYFDGFNSYDYCSLGQQKMSFLSLIFAYIEVFRYKLGFYPIVLIDDVSGELDSLRWKNLISFLEEEKFQVFITTANDNFKQELEKLNNTKKIYMDAGNIIFK